MSIRAFLLRIIRSFPLQLLFLHLRSNLLLLFQWLLLLALMTGLIGRRLGAQYLFVDPEYLGSVDFFSFFFVGIAFGGFWMSWNLTTYLLSSQYFPFLASLSRPFTKFCINNGLLPLGFFLFYGGLIAYFQFLYQNMSSDAIALDLLGLVLGTGVVVLLYALYFQYTNWDISSYRFVDELPPNLSHKFAPGHRKVDLDYIKLDQNRIPVRSYLTENFRARYVRSVAHYESSMLMNIFRQNHLNALILQLLTMLLLLMLGYLVKFAYFRIPAGASVFIFFSLITAVIGAVTYWFNEWRMLIFIGFLIVANYLTTLPPFERHNLAYGLDYTVPPSEYSYDALEAIYHPDTVEQDRRRTIEILNRWKAKQRADKPKMILLAVSGGGLRAAIWTTRVMQVTDSLLDHRLMDRTVLITGASGGMIGLSYLREQFWLEQRGGPPSFGDPTHIETISKDLLNPIFFTLVSNDVFLPWSRFRLGDKTYFKDRAYSFEQQFDENTGQVFARPLSDYRAAETAAEIPMLYLTPSVVNDGRRLVISTQPVSFMMAAPTALRHPGAFEIDAVDFGRLLRGHDADSLRFTTGLRMNATYPYVLPLVHLPTDPQVAVMDAGFRDNYGILSATRFIQVFQEWIRENTSGVVIIQVSSSERIEEISSSADRGLFASLLDPLGIAGKLLVLQEFEQDNSLGFIYNLLGPDQFDVVRFIYRPVEENQLEATISFHIPEQERQQILQAINLPENQESFRRLEHLLR